MLSSGVSKHLPRLDSLRGIAALMVAGFHANVASGWPAACRPISVVLGAFFDGRAGVGIFFVLSGLVLGMSLRRSDPLTLQSYYHFCARRFFRLYPAYFVSTLFYLALYFVLMTRTRYGEPVGIGWCGYEQGVPLTKSQLLQNFFFLSQALNHVTWTLKVEVVVALILPFLHQYSRRFRWKGQALLLLALVALSFIPSSRPTRICLYLFYCGYLIPPAIEKLQAIQFPRKEVFFSMAIIGAVLAFGVSHTFPYEIGGELHGFRWGMFWACIGSVLLLSVILVGSSHALFGILDHRFFRHLGAISYSFYLLDLFCLDICERAFCFIPQTATFVYNPSLLGHWILFVCATALCIALSTVSYHLVERPAVKLGARFY